MLWNLTVSGVTDQPFYPARIGTAFNAKGSTAQATEFSASGLLWGVSVAYCKAQVVGNHLPTT